MSVIGSREVSAGQFKPILMPEPVLVHCLKFIDPIQCGKIAALGRVWSQVIQSRLERLSKRDRIFMLAKLDFVAKRQLKDPTHRVVTLLSDHVAFNFVDDQVGITVQDKVRGAAEYQYIISNLGVSLNQQLAMPIIRIFRQGKEIDADKAQKAMLIQLPEIFSGRFLDRVGDVAFYEMHVSEFRGVIKYDIKTKTCKEINLSFIPASDQEIIKAFIPVTEKQAFVHLGENNYNDRDRIIYVDHFEKKYDELLNNCAYRVLRLNNKVFCERLDSECADVITLPDCEIGFDSSFKSKIANYQTYAYLKCENYYFEQFYKIIRAYLPESTQPIAIFNIGSFFEDNETFCSVPAKETLTFHTQNKIIVWYLPLDLKFQFKTEFGRIITAAVNSDLTTLHVIRRTLDRKFSQSSGVEYVKFDLPEVKKVARAEVRKA